MTMTDMIWEDPPGSRRGTQRVPAYSAEAAELKASPGKWAVLRQYATRGAATGLAHSITAGRYAAFRPLGDFEATSRQDKTTGTYKVYARYLGISQWENQS